MAKDNKKAKALAMIKKKKGHKMDESAKHEAMKGDKKEDKNEKNS